MVKARLAVGLMCVLALAAADTDLYSKARTLYYEVIDGNKDAHDRASELFKKLRDARGGDPKVLAYSGSLELLEASRAFAPWKKGKLAKAGLELLDDAVKRAPEDLEVRFVRAASTFTLPGMFHRREQSEADFTWLAPRVEAAAAAGALDPRLAAAALVHHGLIRERSGDKPGARTAWEIAARVGKGTPAGADAAKRLSALRD